MCGVAGIFNIERFNKNDVHNMIDCIKYRGVDEQRVEEVGPCILGHARLAVVDPINGSQPMTNHDSSVWVVFNGEIYNFVEIRNNLKKKGYKFKSRCDTEVLIHLWREEGENMLKHLIGMFVFFIWDVKQNKGILARDRQGIKPCYFMNIDNGFVFSSEIKSIFTLPGIQPEVDDNSLSLMHSFNYCPPPKTCFKNVSHLDPGTYWLLDASGGRTVKKYWDWPFQSKIETPNKDELFHLLDEAIRLQMRFDVKGCSFLSGGVDSSLVTAHLKEQWNENNMMCFGLDCKVDGYGEFQYSIKAAEELGLDVIPVPYDEKIVIDNLENVVYHTDQPHGDFSFLLIQALCKVANEAGIIVAFNGDGPDEIMSGFNHNQEYFKKNNEFKPKDYFYKKICYFSEEKKRNVLNKDFLSLSNDPSEIFLDMLNPFKNLDGKIQINNYETKFLSPGNNMVKTDRMGASLSIEGRSPYLDHRVTEYLAKIPMKYSFKNGIGKYFLKHAAEKYFSKSFLYRKKLMPTLPIGEWIKSPLKDWAYDTILELDKSRYNTKSAIRLLDDHVKNVSNNTRELRTLFTSSIWTNKVLKRLAS